MKEVVVSQKVFCKVFNICSISYLYEQNTLKKVGGSVSYVYAFSACKYVTNICYKLFWNFIEVLLPVDVLSDKYIYALLLL